MTTASRENERLGSEAVTDGVRVRVRPEFLPQHSDPDAGRWVFAYHITIANEGAEPARLLTRRWVIVDADGERNIVEGDGVVGAQPELLAGESFDYSSFCPLATPWGTMEGAYGMARPDGRRFEARVARFYLAADPDAPEPQSQDA